MAGGPNQNYAKAAGYEESGVGSREVVLNIKTPSYMGNG